jgi:hypothetical protein
MAKKPTDTVQLKLRFPEALRRQIERAAAKQERSMNAEIVHRLEQSFSKEEMVDFAATMAVQSANQIIDMLMREGELRPDAFKRIGDRARARERGRG